MTDPTNPSRFAGAVLPHLDAAYNLARWLTGNDHDAEDVVQESYLRALRFFDGFRGTDGRIWLLTVVRNTCFTWLKHNRPPTRAVPFAEASSAAAAEVFDPAHPLVTSAARETLHQALADLPAEYRETIVLRELEGLSYKEVAAVTGAPLGTVMSRLARGRELLKRSLTAAGYEES